MNTSGNRGKSLERAVLKLFDSYRSRGIHCQQNHPEQIYNGVMVRSHGFDFQMLYHGMFYAFDTKECALNRWPLDKAKPHQLKAMLDVVDNGGTAFFLVHFTHLNRLVKFHASVVQNAISTGNKSMSPDDGEQTTINLLRI